MPRRYSYHKKRPCRKYKQKKSIQKKYTGGKPFTKYCNKLFVGCTNEHCTFAHYPHELCGPEWDAWTDSRGFPTRFVRPDDADLMSKDLRPKASLPFVVRLYGDDSDSSDEEYEPPSISLSQLVKHNEEWKRKKLTDARWARMWHLQKVRHALTTDVGERDMDISDDDKEQQSDLRELDSDESSKPTGKSDLTEKDMEISDESDDEFSKPTGKSDLTELDMELDSDDE